MILKVIMTMMTIMGVVMMVLEIVLIRRRDKMKMKMMKTMIIPTQYCSHL